MSERTEMVAATLGWLGTVGAFVAYMLVGRGRLHVTSLRYGFMNTVAGTFSATAAVFYGAWPSVASNVAWAVVGFATVVSKTRNGDLLVRVRARLGSPNRPVAEVLNVGTGVR